ncbi:MAG: ferritin-like domain-containing protein [Proteobacteria bacterium]|nr:ferritin-like domain-containing protein [Pseudomonadota bacterium]MDA1356770.1 ferritin-like domain-containing protein [Pseudomonadota bacterium]
MSTIITSMESKVTDRSRRRFINGLGKATLSAAAVGLIAGCNSMAAEKSMASGDAAGDLWILNDALGLEHQAINAYQLGAESGLLEDGVLGVAVAFQSQHKGHRDALAGAVSALGGTPVEPKSMGEYATDLNAGTLKNQTDVLMLAARLEKEAIEGYLSVIPKFGDVAYSHVAGRIAVDETMHWTVLAQALGLALPQGPLSFGA